MKKVEELRDLLIGIVPGLKDKPENLSTFVDKGRVGAIRSATLSFEYRYTATIVVQDYAGDVDRVFVPLLAWVASTQPELLRRPDTEPFTYEIELLDSDACDIEIKIELIERVLVAQGDGGWTVKHLDDAPLTDLLAGVPAGTTVHGILLADLARGDELQLPE